jgi:hypothetical protein
LAPTAKPDDIDAARGRRLGFDPSKRERVHVTAHNSEYGDFYYQNDFGLPFVYYLVSLVDRRNARGSDLRQDGIVEEPAAVRPREGRDGRSRKEEEQ